MLRKTFVSIAVSSALYVSSSYALELGELTSQSSLDEPYRGRIEVSDIGNLTVDDILVRLGSESEFRQAGLSPTSILSKLKFDVTQDNGEVIVSISSDQPLLADELHFVLAARWPSGQIVREYQVPLNQSALVEKEQEDTIQASTVDKIDSLPNSGADSSDGAFRQAQLTTPNISTTEKEWNVEKGNTLWSIASKNPVANQLTIYQTMMAIQALNQEAFYSDNINLLKEGSVLRLPTEDQIKLFNKTSSEKEFLRQHEAWLALKNSIKEDSSSVDKAQLNTQAETKTSTSDASLKEDKLTLASGQSLLPENVASSNTGEGNSAALDELKAELSATQETLDKEQREKEELSSQLDDLNEQLATLEELVQLKDKQMAELQQQFVESQRIIEEQREMVDQLLEADQIRREREEAEANSLVNKIFKNPIIVSVGALVLMLLGFLTGFVLRRRSNKIEEEFESLKKDEFDLSDTAPPVAQPAGMDEEYVEDDVIDDDFMEMEDDIVEDDDEDDAFQEEDPFAFDFDGQADDTEDLEADDFSSFEADASAAETEDVEEDIDDEIDPDSELESAIDALAETDDEDFGAFEGGDESYEEAVDEDDIPTVTQEEIIETDIEEPVEEAESDVLEEEPEIQIDEAEETVDTDLDSEEESFVSNLLNDEDQDDVDESDIFNESPSDALASSIEETLAEAQEEQEIDVPEFTEEQAAADEESSDEEEKFDFFDASGDEVATKLDLARAYMDMGDEEGARVILEDVIEAGNEAQVAEAQTMIERMFPSD